MNPAGPVSGLFERDARGAGGALRSQAANYAAKPVDPVVPPEVVRRFRLAGGEFVEADVAPGRPPRVTRVARICGLAAEAYAERGDFAELTVVDPHDTIRLETAGGPTSMRVVDLLTPVGRGQRALIVAPPRSGKTILLQQMAKAIIANHPDVLLMMLLVDERPEEVTEMRRVITPEGSGWHAGKPEVVWSSNDRDVASHLRIARLMIEKARRMLEAGRHVVILLDSLTRLSRAFNSSIGSSGRTMTGGLDINALTEPKAIFGAARNIEGGGSLTIIASVLVETGSRMDDFIFQEFKGTGNMELVLSRELANLRLWPAINVTESGTRKEEKLIPPAWLQKSYRLRRKLLAMAPQVQIETLVKELERFKSNADVFAAMAE
ncbi:MAG: transcription termination factor Rho [Phycisphaerae bacterium]